MVLLNEQYRILVYLPRSNSDSVGLDSIDYMVYDASQLNRIIGNITNDIVEKFSKAIDNMFCKGIRAIHDHENHSAAIFLNNVRVAEITSHKIRVSSSGIEYGEYFIVCKSDDDENKMHIFDKNNRLMSIKNNTGEAIVFLDTYVWSHNSPCCSLEPSGNNDGINIDTRRKIINNLSVCRICDTSGNSYKDDIQK